MVELPDVGERAERDVELAAGPLADLARGAQRLAHVGADRDRPLAGGGVDPQHVAARRARRSSARRADRTPRTPRRRRVRAPPDRRSTPSAAAPSPSRRRRDRPADGRRRHADTAARVTATRVRTTRRRRLRRITYRYVVSRNGRSWPRPGASDHYLGNGASGGFAPGASGVRAVFITMASSV